MTLSLRNILASDKKMLLLQPREFVILNVFEILNRDGNKTLHN